MPFAYVLYSAQLDRYYIGHTEMAVEERLKKHLTDHNGFTGKAKDWMVVWHKEYKLKKDAHSMELRIKGWKSRRLVEKLITRT